MQYNNLPYLQLYHEDVAMIDEDYREEEEV